MGALVEWGGCRYPQPRLVALYMHATLGFPEILADNFQQSGLASILFFILFLRFATLIDFMIVRSGVASEKHRETHLLCDTFR
jgi:hypothetical protein